MKKILFLASAACLLLSCTLPSAAQVPITVFPDPVQFGTVPLKSSGSALVYLDNTTAAAAVISTISITGVNNTDFSFPGPTCVGTISGGQYCQMYVAFTPSALGARSATLAISVLGVTSPILIPLDGTGGNPGPAITSLSPASVYQNSGAITVMITGSGFLSSSVAYFGYGATSPLATTFVSSTELKAIVPASDLTQTGSYAIEVINASGSTSSNFTIVGLDPIVQSVSPTSLLAGSASTPIILNGSNFQTGAKVLWNGTAIPTTYLNSGQIQAQPSTANLASAAIVELAVSNPAPGGLSAPLSLNLTYPVTITTLDLPANDLVWDPFAQLIYASLPSSYGVDGNSVAVINPTTGAVEAYHFAGSEPTKLALSADGKYLYVGLNGDGSVQRLALPNFTLDINISLGTSSSGIYTASDLKVSPTDAHTIAVALAPLSCCGSASVAFFTDSKKLANSVTTVSVIDLEFASGTTLYGYDNGLISQIAVSSTGGTVTQQWSGLVYGNDIQYAAGLIYGGEGQVFDPATGLLTGTFDTGSSCCCCSNTQLLPDSAISRAFVLGTTPFFTSLGITSYNLSQFTPIAVASLAELSGNPASSFIQWGTSGLAFNIQNNNCCPSTPIQTALLQSPTLLLAVVHASKPVPAPLSLSRTSAVHGGWNFTVTIKGSGFVPGSVVTWNGKPLYAQYLSSTQLKLYVPWTKIVSAGTAQIVVENAGPGGGKSAPLTFTIK